MAQHSRKANIYTTDKNARNYGQHRRKTFPRTSNKHSHVAKHLISPRHIPVEILVIASAFQEALILQYIPQITNRFHIFEAH